MPCVVLRWHQGGGGRVRFPAHLDQRPVESGSTGWSTKNIESIKLRLCPKPQDLRRDPRHSCQTCGFDVVVVSTITPLASLDEKILEKKQPTACPPRLPKKQYYLVSNGTHSSNPKSRSPDQDSGGTR